MRANNSAEMSETEFKWESSLCLNTNQKPCILGLQGGLYLERVYIYFSFAYRYLIGSSPAEEEVGFGDTSNLLGKRRSGGLRGQYTSWTA